MSNKRKILFLGRFFPPVHGAAQVNENYFNSKIIQSEFNLNRIKINYSDNINQLGKVNKKKFIGIFRVLTKLISSILVFKPDLIYFEIPTNGFAFYRDGFYAMVCKALGKKIIFQIHGRNLNKTFYAKLIFKNNAMIVLSESLYEEVEFFFNRQEVYFLPNGIEDRVNKSEVNEIVNKDKGEITLLYLSNMYESKGCIETLYICNMIKKKGHKFKCYFVGSWENGEIKNKWMRIREELNLKEECEYLGPKYGKEKDKILKNAHFMIFPTFYKNESFPLVILEALMYGIPVYSYNNGAIKDIISKEYLGCLVEKNDWEKLGECLIEKISKRTNRIKIRRHFLKNFTLNLAEKGLLKIFKKEVEKR